MQTCVYGNQRARSHSSAPHLLQPLHVFEVESNIKKAEIRIYKLKLQDRNVRRHRRSWLNKKKKKSFHAMKSHSLEPF